MTVRRTTDRGYGANHLKLRRWWAPRVQAGQVACARCGYLIAPGTPWDLGHLDGSRKTAYQGPEHRRCNRATATHQAQRRQGQDAGTLRWSRPWF
jgi:hypothetical protein